MLAIIVAVVGVLGGLGILTIFFWWLINVTEGVYVGRWLVILLYDRYASRYDSVKKYDPAVETYFIGTPLMKRIAPNDAPLVLDVATGTGRLPRLLWRQQGFQGAIIACDLSRKMLRVGSDRLAEGMHYGRIHLMHRPAEDLPFPDASFDVVCCLEALEFMTQPKVVLRELVRLTRPGGWLILSNRVGEDARLMPGKTWPEAEARAIYEDELGLQNVEIRRWSTDYDLVWAQKAGDALPVRARPLEEIWCCPRCGERQMLRLEKAFICENCEQRVPIGADGVIEGVRKWV